MKRIILYVLLFCFIGSMASPTRSSVAARQSSLSSEPEKTGIPYVADGLISMWDGIWNSGIGIHETKPTAISDLAGVNSLDLSYGAYGTGIIIGEDYFAPNNVRGGHITNIDMSELADAIMNGVFTIEVCLSIETGAGQLFQIDDTTKVYGTSGQFLSWARFRGSLTNITSLYQNSGEVVTIAMSSGTAGNLIYLDGENKMTFAIGTHAVSNGIEFGNNSAGGMKFRCIRIYNRSLTEEEVEYNHLVDRERFGF